MAQTKEKQHWMHISYQFFVDPKEGYGIKDFGYQVLIAFFSSPKKPKCTGLLTCFGPELVTKTKYLGHHLILCTWKGTEA